MISSVLTSLLAMAAQITAAAPPPSKGGQIPTMPGLIVSPPSKSDPEIWIWPNKGLDPSTMDPRDLKLAEGVFNAVRGDGANSADLKAATTYLAQPKKSGGDIAGQMQASSIDAVKSALAKCRYSRSIIISPPKEAGRRTAFTSWFKCGTEGIDDDAFMSVVIEAHKIKGVFVQPSGAIPGMMVNENG